jgi:hypothetical protein
MDPDTPFRVKVRVPTVACLLTLTVTVACAEFVPFNVIDVGATLQVTFAGTPLHERETFPVKPVSGFTVSV